MSRRNRLFYNNTLFPGLPTSPGVYHLQFGAGHLEASQILVSVSLGAAQATPIKLHTVPLSFLTLASISAPIPAAADLYSTAPVGATEKDWAVVVEEIFVAPVGDVGFPLTGKFAGVVQYGAVKKQGFYGVVSVGVVFESQCNANVGTAAEKRVT